ncbi:PAS domain-containing protein [Fodinibius sp. Rm-B-1B1-1]|uniref:PAS domain-containing protein n=1 Tax=Fodinibius alkaliphilus TaxID=3140241 RepID=UPI00315AB429
MPDSKQHSDKRNIQLKKLLKKSSIIHYRRLTGSGCPIIGITKNVKDVLGFSESDFLADENLWFNRAHPEDRLQLQEHFDKVSSEEVPTVEYRFKHKSGSYIWLRDETQLIESNDSGEQFFSGFITPLTKSKKPEITEDRERQKLQQLALDNLNDMVVITKALRDKPLQSHIIFCE